MNRPLAAALWFLIAIAILGGAADAGERHALVIGNGAYADSPLRNPVNDARLMAEALRSHGFSVTEALDIGQIAMKRAIKDYGNRLEAAGPDAVGWFFYAGHGLQVGGENYLIPVGAEIEDEADVDIYAVAASNLLKTLGRAGNGLNIVVLDACRNNPFMRAFRSPQRGLALMSAPTGTLIAYSTAPGEVAADGDGDNSPFSTTLATQIGRPGVPIELMFRSVRQAVLAATQGRQTPWEASSLTGADFYLVPALATDQPPPDAGTRDLALWNTVKDSDDPDRLQSYLTAYPNGIFAALARLRIDELHNPIVVPPALPPDEVLPTNIYDGIWEGYGNPRCTGDKQDKIRKFQVTLDVSGDQAQLNVAAETYRIRTTFVTDSETVIVEANGNWNRSFPPHTTAFITIRGSLEDGAGQLTFTNPAVSCRGDFVLSRIDGD